MNRLPRRWMKRGKRIVLWGQATAKTIVDETDGLDDSAAEEQMAPRLRALRLMMRAIGRWTGEANNLDARSRSMLWARVAEQARVVFGDTFVLPAMDEVLAQVPSGASAEQVVMWLKTLFEERKPKG
jgi:hypothetical protein